MYWGIDFPANVPSAARLRLGYGVPGRCRCRHAPPPNAPVIQLAMLDTVGGTRGTDINELGSLQDTWKESPVQPFSSASELEAWEKNWPNGDGRPAAKIIYDPAAGEVRVSGRSRGKFFQRTFPLEKDDLALTLQHVREFVREQTKT